MSPDDNNSSRNDGVHHFTATSASDDDNDEDEAVVRVQTDDVQNEIVDDDGNIWASHQGYTPLHDMNLLMSGSTSMPGSDDNNDRSGTVLFFQGVSGNTIYASRGGAFFTDMNAFGAAGLQESKSDDGDDDDDDVDNHGDGVDHKVVHVEADHFFGNDFRNVADQALQSLEADYLATIQGEVRSSILEESLFRRPPTAAATIEESSSTVEFRADFDKLEPSKEPDTSEQQETIHKDDNEKPQSSLSTKTEVKIETSLPTTTTATDQNIDTATDQNIDTDAVRKAVQAIHLRDPKLTNAFQDWERSQKEATARVPARHSLIPSAPLAAFRKKTPKAFHATANLSRSATIAEAVVRFNILKQQEKLILDVVGCDQVECETADRIRTLFAPVVRWIAASAHAPDQLEIRLIGPCMPENAIEVSPIYLIGGDSRDSSKTTTTTTTTTMSSNSRSEGRNRLKRAQVSCHLGVYDEWLSRDDTLSPGDLTIAFNAGVWGYNEWRTTILKMLQRKDHCGDCLFVVTAYTLYEAEDDFEVIKEELLKVAPERFPEACLFEPEYNPYASKIDRSTQSAVPGRRYRENSAWQAWRL